MRKPRGRSSGDGTEITLRRLYLLTVLSQQRELEVLISCVVCIHVSRSDFDASDGPCSVMPSPKRSRGSREYAAHVESIHCVPRLIYYSGFHGDRKIVNCLYSMMSSSIARGAKAAKMGLCSIPMLARAKHCFEGLTARGWAQDSRISHRIAHSPLNLNA